MRSIVAIVAIATVCALLVGCSNGNITDVCASGARTGTSPTCVLTAQCTGSNTGVKLDCSGGNNSCVCSKNRTVGATVPYQDAFCSEGDPSNFSTMEDTLQQANSACGWGL